MKAGLKFIKFFKRPCDRCGKVYQRTGKYQKICDECYGKVSGISKNRENLNNIVTENLKHVIRLVETIQEYENIIFDLENMFLGKRYLLHVME
jgi:protein-arginine kinase activator protein McsA